MKLVVLVPSEEYKSYAGTRIRYHRIQSSLQQHGITMSVEAIDAFDPRSSDCDVLLISKCHEARAIVIAAHLKSRGKIVGPDLFDDYFSDATDARLMNYRDWLGQLVDVADFGVCSTPAMADVVASIYGDLPIHVMNDPGAPFDPQWLKGELDRKLSQALTDNILRVAWYGVGDNAFFPVGLDDLSAFGDRLNELERSPMAVRLTVLTNKRALSSASLHMIAQLPVQTELMEWSERAEQQLLADSLAVFLPVSAQPFSRAKSLNRAVTALSAGCQVLSVGYPLYQSLTPFVYRDPIELRRDVGDRRLKLSPHKLGHCLTALDAFGSAQTEAAKLSQFVRGLASSRGITPHSIRVIHGASTREDVHRLIKSAGGLSVASPYTSARFDFDIRFQGGPSRLTLSVSDEAASGLQSSARAQLRRMGTHGKRFSLTLSPVWRRLWAKGLGNRKTARSDALILGTYQQTMKEIAARMDELFGPGRNIVCEYSRLPVPRTIEGA